MYFIVKNHSFSDGNKRIAAAVFAWFLDRHDFLYNDRGEKRIADNALVAFTLLIAESKPGEREIIVKVIINLINEQNGLATSPNPQSKPSPSRLWSAGMPPSIS